MRCLPIFGFLAIVLAGCQTYEEPESGIDCGRQFINATYQGNFKHARQLVIPDDLNEGILKDRFEAPFRKLNSSEKEELSQSSIQISEVKGQGDSVQLVTYHNAYQKQPLTLRCVNRSGVWRTDLSYSFK